MNNFAELPSTAGLIKEAKAFHLKKHLGQHFLINVEALQTIASALDAHAGDTILEIGPGLGFLTRFLAKTGARVVAVDLDRESIDALKKQAPSTVETRHGDILQFDLRSLSFFPRKRKYDPRKAGEDGAANADEFVNTPATGAEDGTFANEDAETETAVESTNAEAETKVESINGHDRDEPHPAQETSTRLKVVGNVPYQITGLIIGHLLGELGTPSPWLHLIDNIVLTVQYEVAKRIVAKPGEDDYSRVSLLASYFCKTELITALSAADFVPPPEVRSAVVKLTPLAQPAVSCRNPVLLRQLINAGFRQRRKMLRNSLSVLRLPQNEIDSVFRRLNVDPQVRAERLGLPQFAMLADAFSEVLEAHANNHQGISAGQD